jgi:hypothetical protein
MTEQDTMNELKNRIDKGKFKPGHILSSGKKKATGLPEGYWKPIKIVNGMETTFCGWKDKRPYLLNTSMKKEDLIYTFTVITLKNHDGENILDEIKKFRDPENELIEFKGEVFTKSEFTTHMVYPINVNHFTECLNALPVEEGEYREPKFYFEDDHILFPANFYARRDDSYQKILKNALKIGEINMELYEKGIEMLRKFPKQLTLFYSVIGANIVNILDINDYPITIDAVGHKDTGKSYAIDMALKLAYGIGEAILQDDAIKSAFRHHATANSTNLVIYIEEAKLSAEEMKKMKSKALNLRGNSDKSMTVYGTKTTWVLSRNSKDDGSTLTKDEREAQEKRIYEYIFTEDDVVPAEIQAIGKDYKDKIKDEPGGLLYKKVKEKTITEMKKKYFELLNTNEESMANQKRIARFGAWIMDDPDFEPVVSEIKPPNILDDFYSILIGLFNRKIYLSNIDHEYITNQRDKNFKTEFDVIDLSTNEFYLTVTGYKLLQKEMSELKNMTATEFAKFCGLKLTKDGTLPPKWFNGTNQRVLTGKIPDEFFREDEC